MNKKVALVLTGGTIGSEWSNYTLDLPKLLPLPLLDRYRLVYPEDTTDFDVFCPIHILSENITEPNLHRLMELLLQLSQSDYSGILITHGSDTVHFTAAMASLLLAKTKIPIVFTCSLKSSFQPDTDAFYNIRLATGAIEQQLDGVWFAFKNANGNPFLLDASRMAPCTQSGSFYDYYETPAYELEGKHFIGNPLFSKLPLNHAYTLPEKFPKVLFLRPYPLMDYTTIDISAYDLVLHSGYHSSTACCIGATTSIIFFAERCAKEGKPLYFLLPEKTESIYGSTAQILSTTAIPLYGYTPYGAYAHLLLNKQPLLI